MHIHIQFLSDVLWLTSFIDVKPEYIVVAGPLQKSGRRGAGAGAGAEPV
jgi:hypothetical protein